MPGNIWNKPAVPHALDDEFESVTLDPSWDFFSAPDFVTPHDPYAVVATPRIKIHTDSRPSWLTCQGATTISKAYTLPTNCLIWARMFPYTTTAAKVDGDYFCGIGFIASTGGAHDSATSVQLRIRAWANNVGVEFFKTENAGFPVVATIAPAVTRGLSYEYMCLHKIGSAFHGWVITSGGVRTYLGSTTSLGAGTLDRVHVSMGAGETVPGSPIQGIDFFRVVESATYLP